MALLGSFLSGDGLFVNELGLLLKELTPEQLSFVQHRLLSTSDAEAARRAGIARNTMLNWKANGVPLDQIVQLSRLDGVEVAREKLRRLASRAVDVIEDEMEAKRGSPRRLEAALQALNRLGLEAKTGVDVTSGGKSLFDLEDWKRDREQRLSSVADMEDVECGTPDA